MIIIFLFTLINNIAYIKKLLYTQFFLHLQKILITHKLILRHILQILYYNHHSNIQIQVPQIKMESFIKCKPFKKKSVIKNIFLII